MKVDRAEFAELAARGWTNKQLQEHFNVNAVTIWRIRKATGTTTAIRVTPERKARLRQMIEDGWSFAEITRTEGADRETLQRHFPGKQWTVEQSVEYRTALRAASPYHFNQRDDRWKQAA